MISCDVLDSNQKHNTDVDTSDNEIIEKNFDNKMIVYRGNRSEFYIVDTETYEVIKKVDLPVPLDITVNDIQLSTNKEYIIYSCCDYFAPFNNYIFSYDIYGDSVFSEYKTGLDSAGNVRMIAALKPQEPGLFYMYNHHVGLYAIDFLKKTIKTISTTTNYYCEFYNSPDNEWIGLSKYYPGSTGNFTELKFYKSQLGLNNVQFKLNENDQDSVSVSDMVFSEDNSYLYFSYLLSKNAAKGDAQFFGCYNLETRKSFQLKLNYHGQVIVMQLHIVQKEKNAI